MSVTKGLLVRFDALPGKEDDVKEFLDSGRALVEEEPATTAWFAIRLGPTSLGIFDVFPDNAGRDAHLSGTVAEALGDNTGHDVELTRDSPSPSVDAIGIWHTTRYS